MGEFTMPSLGADMTEGTLLEWVIHPGDQVRKGDIVAVVDTAKAAIEVECFETGTVRRLLVEPGQTVAVGTPLAVIAPADAPEAPGPAEPPAAAHARPPRTPLIERLAEQLGVDLDTVHGSGPGGRITRADVTAARPAPPTTGPAAPASAAHPAKQPPAARDARVRATPMARRLADEAGIDLSGVHGTGAGGAVRAGDVRALLPTTAPVAPEPARPTGPPTGPPAGPPAADLRPEPTGRPEAMRRAVGELMARSKREIPHYYLSTTIDLAIATGWLRDRNRELPVPERMVPAALLLKAAARAAREVPELNGFFTGGHFVPAEDVHLGVAVSLRGGGLVAPAIHHAADLPLPELMTRLRDVVARARAGRLRGSETTDPTITVTNLGDQGVEAVFGVIYPPQVALVGFGKVLERPWAAEGLLGVRPVVTATLSADHRASDGATGARYLTALERLLRTPEEL